MSGEIDHKAVVQEIGEHSVTVRFISQSACASCHAKGACMVSESSEKTLEISKPSWEVLTGQEVEVVLSKSLGFKAVAYGYVLPFFLVLISLLSLSSIGMVELQAGLISLSALFPYYLILYLLRDKFTKKYSFSIRKVQ